jgi:protein-disulfide isomerase
VSSTPTFYVNGRKIPQVVPPQYIDALIEMELKRAK